MYRLLAAFLLVSLGTPSVLGVAAFEPYATTNYTVTYEVVVRNLGPSDAFTIPLRVALLRTWEAYQYVDELMLAPEPAERYQDSLGNSFAVYYIDRLPPNEAFTVRVSAKFRIHGIDYNISPSEVGDYDPDDPNYRDFITRAKFIESDDPGIRTAAQEILQNSSSLMDVVFRSYNWVIDNLDFERLPLELGAAYAYKNREGDSAEFSNLLVALLRANQVPAQRVSGWGGTLNQGESYTINRVAHGWAEYYLPSYGWIPLDPTFGQLQRYDNFAKANDRHVVLTKGAGVHLFTRGAYETPFGEADILTDYVINVNEKTTEYTSTAGRITMVSFFAAPVIAFAFLFHKARRGARGSGRRAPAPPPVAKSDAPGNSPYGSYWTPRVTRVPARFP